jgi:hypothetical protein
MFTPVAVTGRALATVGTSLPAMLGVLIIMFIPYLGGLVFVLVWLVLLFGPWSAALVGAFRYLRNATGDRPTLDPRWLQHGGNDD